MVELLDLGAVICEGGGPQPEALDTARMPPRILVDADACPVKEEVYRVAQRLAVPVVVVSNSKR